MSLHKFLILIFFTSKSLLGSEYEITVLATNTANFGGIGEWSFAALLESEEEKILFDTGFDENTVLHNAELLKKDLSLVEKVILSHFHGNGSFLFFFDIIAKILEIRITKLEES